MEYNNEAKLNEQNSSRLRDSKKGLVITKGEGCGRVGGEGGRRGLRGIMISTHGVGGHRENSVAQRRHMMNLWHLAALMDTDCIGVWVGLDNMGKCSSHIVFSCETFLRVCINYTLIKKTLVYCLRPTNGSISKTLSRTFQSCLLTSHPPTFPLSPQTLDILTFA